MKSQTSNVKRQEYRVPPTRNGFAAIVAVLSVMAIGLVFTSSFLFTTQRNAASVKNTLNSAQGYYASESGIEDAIYRVRNGKNIGTQTVLAVGLASATTTISSMGQTKTILAEGGLASNIRKTQTTLTLSATETDFFYGVQVGEGGLTMGNNAIVNGSIYSNGNVSGSNGAKITGDAWVAGGSNPALGTSWETPNADFAFGTTVGSTLATVDASGDTGEYTSLALGSDGFGRISYMDNTNDDLRYARCTNANCTTSVLTAVDTAGSVYEVTSLALDANDFAHISYYHDGNDDQKYAQCANADCTSSTLTLIETSGNVGDASAIKIGSDGFARIAYFQDDDGDVKYARCTNADCTTKAVNMVDATGYSGEHLSLALGSNGFARISYYDDTSNELKFARCLDADCTTKNITIVDTNNDVGKYNSLVLDGSNFGRISYFDETSDDLKFVRCGNEDCTVVSTVTVVDSSGTIGHYTSITLGTDGFARISYYDSSNGDLKFARCTNADCTTKVLTTVDNGSSVGKYTSLALGSDGFGRISYRDDSNDDLKFVRCIDADCTGPILRADVAQSFQLTSSDTLRRVSLYLKKVGNPPDATVRVTPDEGGRPDNESNDSLAVGTLSASSVTGNYGWIDVSFATNPTLNAGTTYWVMIDADIDANNYWVWGVDTTDAYAQGTGKYSGDWTTGGTWPVAAGDFNFRVWVGGSDTELSGMVVNGHAHAHSIKTSSICGDAYYQAIDADSLNFLDAPTNPTCPNPLTNGTAYPGSTDPPAVAMPISQANITQWKNDAAAGGTCIQPTCDASGNLNLTNGAALTIGPKQITGNLVVDNNAILTLSGTLWVQGTITLSNGCRVQLDPSYGDLSGIFLTDSSVTVSNNCIFAGSGDPDSHIMLLSAKNDPNNTVMSIDNGATGVIYYAANGRIHFSNNAAAKEATGYGISMDNNAIITYESGLQGVNFSSGPAAGWTILGWKEVP
ncbi:MAG: hypothetical protein AAB581_04085 [Patescibacteria group bacterium]